MRGARRNSFQAREADNPAARASGSLARRTPVKAVVRAARPAVRMKGGTSCRVGTGWRNSSLRPIAPEASQAASGMPAGRVCMEPSSAPQPKLAPRRPQRHPRMFPAMPIALPQSCSRQGLRSRQGPRAAAEPNPSKPSERSQSRCLLRLRADGLHGPPDPSLH